MYHQDQDQSSVQMLLKLFLGVDHDTDDCYDDCCIIPDHASLGERMSRDVFQSTSNHDVESSSAI